jgi:GAF domain-containing protein
MEFQIPVDFQVLVAQAQGLMSGQNHRVANAANLCALLYQELPEVIWVGFYFAEGDELMLGPFQGKPACVRIPMGQGVCGTAAATGKVQRVARVHDFDGHIACDTDSESELVIPLFKNEVMIGVLDIDSPLENRFSRHDESGLVQIAGVFLDSIA